MGATHCIFGRVALRGSLPPLDPEQTSSDSLLYTDGRFVELYQHGAVDGLSVDSRPGGCVAVWGSLGESDYEREFAWATGDDPAALLRTAVGTFTLVDVRTNESGPGRVQICTDKYGFRTVFYIDHDGVFAFSSHLGGLRRVLPGPWPETDFDALVHYYHFGITSNEGTLLKGVKKVPPATVFEVGPEGLRARPYFDPLDLYEPERYMKMGVAEVARNLDERMAAAVQKRCSASTSTALSVSGGVDSGYIATKLQAAGSEFRGYNLAYKGYYDEFDRVDQLSKEIGVDVVRMEMSVEDVLVAHEASNRVGSEPVGMNDAVLARLARRAAQDGVRVLWDGDGADRLFMGMNSHLKYWRARRLYKLLLSANVLPLVTWALAKRGGREDLKLLTVLKNWSVGIPVYTERKYGATGAYSPDHEMELYETAIKPTWDRFQARCQSADLFLFMTYFSVVRCPELFFHTPVEQQWEWGVRPLSPFWDDDVVSLALSVPTRMKLKGNTTKFILRKAAAIGGNRRYWSLPKVGLEDASLFVKKDRAGASWVAGLRHRTQQEDGYAYLEEALGTRPDPDRLLSYTLWKEGQRVTPVMATLNPTFGAPHRPREPAG